MLKKLNIILAAIISVVVSSIIIIPNDEIEVFSLRFFLIIIITFILSLIIVLLLIVLLFVIMSFTFRKEEYEDIPKRRKKLFNLGELETEDLTYLSDARSISLLKKSQELIDESINSINNNETIEIVEFNIKDAWETLGEIIGETYKEELIDELFSRFCLGK